MPAIFSWITARVSLIHAQIVSVSLKSAFSSGAPIISETDMSEPRDRQARDTAGAPVEEAAPGASDVLAAAERANGSSLEAEYAEAATAVESSDRDAVDSVADTTVQVETREATAAGYAANVYEDGEETRVTPDVRPNPDELDDTALYRERVSQAHTEPYEPIREEPGAVATPAAVSDEIRTGDGVVVTGDRIILDRQHPMAPLYLQAPAEPEPAGNRLAGILISLVATVAFALVYAGILAAGLAPHHPRSTFLDEGLLPHLTSWGFIAATAGFFIGMVLLVLIVGRAGWWAYVLGGFWVAVIVAAAATLGYRFSTDLTGLSSSWDLRSLYATVTLPQVIAAALVAREVTVWFGAWIGARGRKVTARNREAQAEYEIALEENRARTVAPANL